MTRSRRNYFAKSNRGKFGEVFFNNVLAGPSKAERVQAEREERVRHLFEKHGLGDLNAGKILKLAADNSISIDQIEKRILLPIVEERSGRSPARKLIANAGYQIRSAGQQFAALIGKLITLVVGFSLIAFASYTLSLILK
jgi:hypothetical protein